MKVINIIFILILDGAHTRTHEGIKYHLTKYGSKNFDKLLNNGQLEKGVPPKKCQECNKMMDWTTDGPIKKQKNGVYTYQSRHNGGCLKQGFNDENNLKVIQDTNYRE
jgi:hypothetical protein